MKTWVILQKPRNYKIYFYTGVFSLVILSLSFSLLFAFLGIQSKTILFIGFLITVSVVVWLAYQLGSMMHEASLIFIQNTDHRLYVIDIRQTAKTVAIQSKNMEKYLKVIKEKQLLPKNAKQIAYIDKIRHHMRRSILSCRDEYNQPFTLIISQHYPDIESLWLCLERIPSSREIKTNKKIPAFIGFLCLFLLSIFICIESHPYFGNLPQPIYFPMLLFSFILLIIITYLIVKIVRHE